ncbi:hypothetical protein PAXRUDRAFT_16380 [Paxillus rubicundulus Ve08.2h10]|uniref:C2HC/C3H-type domain-containing protein n=1 Tax=Paxillus rubicundulus Ve08.2h10 TaxID=930991 RepID=A0A0D0C8V1_9AGAM|nr:hypothetical protein PAXRUDRAFT_16380 [Paxillus rubicundulus Ve08.2h10]
MPAQRKPRAPYNYSEETLTRRIPCPHCGKQFKPQGFKKHEASCNTRSQAEEENAQAGHRFEQALRDQLEMQSKHGAALNDSSASSPLHLHRMEELQLDRMRWTFTRTKACWLLYEPGDGKPGSPVPQTIINPPTNFKTEYHPRSQRPTLFQNSDHFRLDKSFKPLPDHAPWRPFRCKGDFKFAEIALNTSLNQKQVDDLLNLIARVTKGTTQVTLKNEQELRKACDAAVAELTPFIKHSIAVPYKGEDWTFEIHARYIWQWVLDLLNNPHIASHFIWDAKRLYKHNGVKFERFYDEPWTADSWWDIQSELPASAENTVPLALILYADKSKLSLFGTVKGYPVVNVFWIVLFSDPHKALSFNRLHALHLGLWGKHVLGELKKILAFLGQEAEAEVERYVTDFPSWRNLSHFHAVVNITFNNGNKMNDLAKQVFYALLNILKKNTVPEGYTLLQMLQTYLELDSLISLDVHTETTLSMIEKELPQFNDALNEYIELAMKSNIEGLRVDWDFPKVHAWKHIVNDIRRNGAARNFSQDEDEEQHDQEQIMAIIQPLLPDADIPALCKALSLAQRALTETDADLCRVKKELFALTAALPPKKHKGILNKSDSLNESIGQVAKKFAMLYCLWVIDGLFLIVNNTGVDLSSTTRWASPEAKRNAVITELFTITPQVLTKEIHAYKAFSLVISPEGFLRSPVLINIIRLLISGRTALTGEKAHSGPKARGQIYGVHSVTEGLVVRAAIFARYLLTPDTELQAVGSEIKIPYEGDYDFYLKRLYKRSPWAIEMMNFFNVEVFGNNKAREKSSEPTVPSAPLRTWEDNFLEDLDNAGSPAQTTTSTSASAHLNFTGNSSVPGLSPPRSPRHSPLLSCHHLPPRPSHSLPPGPGSISHPDLPGPPYLPPHSVNNPPESSVATSNAMVSIHNYPGASSAVSQLQVEVGQMSLFSSHCPHPHSTS